VASAYALAVGGLLLLCGRIGDAYGRRRAFRIGLSAFTFASLIGGFATDGRWAPPVRPRAPPPRGRLAAAVLAEACAPDLIGHRRRFSSTARPLPPP
jgi:MFS family permease